MMLRFSKTNMQFDICFVGALPSNWIWYCILAEKHQLWLVNLSKASRKYFYWQRRKILVEKYSDNCLYDKTLSCLLCHVSKFCKRCLIKRGKYDIVQKCRNLVNIRLTRTVDGCVIAELVCLLQVTPRYGSISDLVPVSAIVVQQWFIR